MNATIEPYPKWISNNNNNISAHMAIRDAHKLDTTLSQRKAAAAAAKTTKIEIN